MPKPVLDGYTFAGWFTSMENGKQISESVVVDITSGIMLYARWNGKKATVNFRTDDGTPVDSIEVYFHMENYRKQQKTDIFF